MAYDRYAAQVQLLVRILPFVADEAAFALKGGTAINLFYRDMPRLSVDIDLVYLPIEDRTTSLHNIDAALERIEQGTYGYSDVSGQPIQRERLEAIPETTVLAAEKVSGIGPR